MLDQEIQPAGLTQNAGKAEHIAAFLGAGQDKFTKGFHDKLQEHELGALKKNARYLGAWPQYNGSTGQVVQKRIRAAKEAYYGMGKAWRANIGLQVKDMAFNNLVVNSTLSGMARAFSLLRDFGRA